MSHDDDDDDDDDDIRSMPSSDILLSPDHIHLSSRHSEWTVPTSNVSSEAALMAADYSSPPPQHILEPPSSSSPFGRRNIFAPPVQHRYRCRSEEDGRLWHPDVAISPLPSPIPSSSMTMTTPLQKQRSARRLLKAQEALHAQSLLLGCAFCAVWSASNLMAPNLTQMALDLKLQYKQRDLYLGSYCSLATGVLSFPLAAILGMGADVGIVSRKTIFAFTVLGGGLSSVATALYATHYYQLLAFRLINGGFMNASVPVAFSLLGDWFSPHERNKASSGLTALMGLGILGGQVYAGFHVNNWRGAFVASGIFAIVMAGMCFGFIQEPERGGKEQALQDMLQQGTRYERKLTLTAFIHAMRHNKSNSILLWQGFFSSLPWGIIFVFLNDYLSQERGFSVKDATFLVLVFGVGCFLGGILGGYGGQAVQTRNRSYLPLFMAATTLLGIVPFVGLLNTEFTNARGVWGISLSLSGGLIASLPAVNVRPCLINVNLPETRGASLTAANALIQLGRGLGPSCVTLMGSIFHMNRQEAFNLTVRAWRMYAMSFLHNSIIVSRHTAYFVLGHFGNSISVSSRNIAKRPG